MAIIQVSVGNRSAENVSISSVADSGPWTVTLSGAPTTTIVGDKLTDEAATPNTYLITAINGADLTVRDAFGAGTAPVTGGSQATTVRSYAHLVAADADLDDTTIYGVGDEAHLAVCEFVTVAAVQTVSNGSTRGLSKIKIFGHADYRHDFTIGSHAGFTFTNGNQLQIMNITCSVDVEISWLRIFANVTSGVSNKLGGISTFNQANSLTAHHCIIHAEPYDAAGGTTTVSGIKGNSTNTILEIHNNLIFGFSNATAGTQHGMYAYSAAAPKIYNNTIYGCGSYGIRVITQGDARNNIVIDCGTDFSGTFDGTSNNNIDSDATAPGGLSVHSETAADMFVDHASDDFHIESDSAAIGAAENLEGALDDIEVDLDGESRPSSPTAWDVGADYYVAPPLAGIPCTDIEEASFLGY